MTDEHDTYDVGGVEVRVPKGTPVELLTFESQVSRPAKAGEVIKAAGTAQDGTPLLLVGLTADTLTRLQDGEPIRFDTDPLGLPTVRVIVVAGQTAGDLVAKLADQELTR